MEIPQEAIDNLKSNFSFPKKSIEEAYHAGYDCGQHRASLSNCHFSIFSSQEHTAAWNEGKKDAEEGRKNKYFN